MLQKKQPEKLQKEAADKKKAEKKFTGMKTAYGGNSAKAAKAIRGQKRHYEEKAKKERARGRIKTAPKINNT